MPGKPMLSHVAVAEHAPAVLGQFVGGGGGVGEAMVVVSATVVVVVVVPVPWVVVVATVVVTGGGGGAVPQLPSVGIRTSAQFQNLSGLPPTPFGLRYVHSGTFLGWERSWGGTPADNRTCRVPPPCSCSP